MDLGQGELSDAVGNFLWAQAQLIPTDDPPDGDAGPGHARSSAAHLWRSNDQRADVNYVYHPRAPFCQRYSSAGIHPDLSQR